MDIRGQGGITPDDISMCFKRFGRKLSQEKIIKWINECDENNDGMIQLNEFVMLMQKESCEIVNQEILSDTSPMRGRDTANDSDDEPKDP